MAIRFLVLWALVAAVSAGKYLQRDPKEVVVGEYIVVLKSNSTDADIESHMQVVGDKVASCASCKVHRSFNVNDEFKGYHASFTPALIRFAVNHAATEYVEPNQKVYASQSCRNQVEATWGLVRTSERDLLLDGMYTYHSGDGEGVNVYILDTGIYTANAEFQGRAIFGTDTVDSPPVLSDYNGHGTHVAGTVVSKDFGIAKSATAIAVKVLGADGSGSTAGVIAGIEYAVTEHKKGGKSVINMSLGGGFSAALNAALNAAVNAGIPAAIAAGNENQDACNVSPASASGAFTVGSSTNTDARSSFSNYGTCVDIFAPGSSITSTWIGGKYATNTISGTSMASPHVAGVMAKILSTAGNEAFTAKDVYETLKNTATPSKVSDTKGSPNKLLFRSCD